MEVRHVLVEVALECEAYTAIVVFADFVVGLVNRRRRALDESLGVFSDACHEKPVFPIELLGEARHDFIACFHDIGGIAIFLLLGEHFVDLT